ncbi:unnamed protein product [Strongylus vulgaris]|uniref:Uncharacterized protein n=1 Tax=Strongylus vulgaris TaxID=40348 RepID=A0A3P7J3D9_STRVU|nr:unnamed protein product [Strongylus vulgaris]
MLVRRSYASIPEEEGPAFDVEPEHFPVAHAAVGSVAPLVASFPTAPVFPTLSYHHMFPYGHYYHPPTAVHNVAKSYAKESGHAFATSVVSENGYLHHGLGLHFPHLADALTLAPWRSRLHKQKAAKKVLKAASKTVNKKTQ